MENHERYKHTNTASYNRFSWQHALWRVPSDKTILPYIAKLQVSRVLDVGIGTGWYVPFFQTKKAEVIGVDLYPKLCPHPIRVEQSSATNFAALFTNENFDLVFSSWVSEYFNNEDLSAFVKESAQVLVSEGQILFTIIPPRGWGWFYIKAARLKGILKYNHSQKFIETILHEVGFEHIKFTALHSYGAIPWAILVHATKTRE